MNVIAVIPARGGSKRLPGKNIKNLMGKPLISWSIDAALESNVFSSIIVSTDDEEIAKIASRSGASVPGMRPAGLASDTATSVSVALHVIDEYEKEHRKAVSGLVLLQPTSPFRSVSSIRKGVQLMKEFGFDRPVVGVKPADSHPAWCFFEEKDVINPVLGWDALKKRAQDLCPAWALNGAFYGISPALLRASNSFITPDTVFLKMDGLKESVDIDTEYDWRLAEFMISAFD